MAIHTLPLISYGQGVPGVGVGVPVPGVGIPINALADYPNPYANKAPAYRSTYLYRSAELQALSGGKPMAIRSIFFEVQIPQRALLQNYTIRMKQVSWNEMQNPIPDGGFTEVYWAKPYVENAGFNEHKFDVPFCWDGVSNFIIDICVQNQAADKSYNATTKGSTPDSVRNTSYHDWNNTGDPICLEAERVQPQLYKKRPLTYFAAIPADSTDLRMVKVLGPSDLVDAGQIHQVKARFQNYSCPQLSGVKLGYRWNNGPPVIENYTPNLATGEYVDYTFNTTLSLPIAEFGVLKVWTQHPDDIYPQNDTLTYLVFVKDDKFAGLDYAGDDFWVAFMQNYANQGIDQRVFLTSTNYTFAKVGVPLLGWDTTVSLTPNQVLGVKIPLVINGVVTATEPSEVVSPTGVHITSSSEISVYGYSGVALSTDAYLAVPRRTLGRKYTVYAPEGIYQPIEAPPTLVNAPAEFIVVGTENNTNVVIVPSKPTQFHAQGDTIRVTLNKGETFLVKARVDQTDILGIPTYTTTYDLSGSQVMADKKIGLIGGSICAYIPGMTQSDKCESCDHLLEMLTPPHTWGKDFYITDFEFKPGDDVIRLVNGDSVVANVSINGTIYQVPTHSYKDVKFQGEVAINSDRPIQAVQMCTGGQCTLPASPTDPFISNMIPEAQWGNYYTFTTPTTPNLSLHYINIVKRSPEGRVGFDGYILNNSIFKRIGSTNYYITKMAVSQGAHKVSGDSLLFVNVYGFGRDNSYGYPASGSLLKTTALPLVEITGTADNSKCFGQNTGHIKVEGHEGTPPYSFYWNDGENGDERSDLKPGNYWVFVEDDYGYRDTAFFTITQPDSLEAIINHKNISCYQAKNGELHVSAKGGTSPYKFKWLDGPTTTDRTGLDAGLYTIEITDSNSCKVTDTVRISEPAQIILTLLPKDPSCHDLSDGKINSSTQNGFPPLTYNWIGYPANKKDSLTNIPPGSYTLQISDTAGCTANASTSLSNPSQIKPAISSTNIACFETASGKAKATATGGRGVYTFHWERHNSPDVQEATGLSKGWHFVYVNDGACIVKDSTFIDSVNSPVFSVNSIYAVCDKPTGSATVQGTGGTGVYNYTFNTSPPQKTATATKLSPGNYTVTVSDGNCIMDLPFSIDNVGGPEYKVVTRNLTCGLTNGEARLDSLQASGPYTIKWLTTPIQNNVLKIDSLKAGTYSVEVKDSVCTITRSFTLIRIQQPTVSSITKVQPDCSINNGALTLNATGGSGPLTISWNTTPPRTGATIDNLYPGSYQATITDGECVTEASTSLSSKNGPKVFLKIIQPKCDLPNGRIIASVIGGSGTYTYQWNGDPSLTNDTIDNIPAGSYSVLIDDGTCKTGADTVLKGSPKPIISLTSSQPNCGKNNGSVKVTHVVASPTFTQYWNGVAGNDSITGLGSGHYVYSIFDGTCWASDSADLQASPPMLANISHIDSSYCGSPSGSATLDVSGGDGIYSITWKTIPEQSGPKATALSTGIYKVIYTDYRCIDSMTVTIPELRTPYLSSTTSLAHCDKKDGSVSVTASGGIPPYRITWTHTNSSAFTLNALDSGWYFFTVNDSLCESADSAYVPWSAPPKIYIDSVIPAHCGLANGEIFSHISGTQGNWTVSWNSNPAQPGLHADNLPGGNYTGTLSDQFCTVSEDTVIQVIPQMQLSVVQQTEATCDLNNASIKIKAESGSGPYRYFWPTVPGNTTDFASSLPGGWISYQVSDDYCTIKDSGFIQTISKPVIASVQSSPDWCGLANGSAVAFVSGGTGNYTYNWSCCPGQNNDSVSGVLAGNYTIQIVDGNCTVSENFTITRNYAPYGRVDVYKNEACDQSNGRARLLDLSPANAKVDWNNTGFSGSEFINLKAGTYSVKLSNDYCDTVINFAINAIPAPSLTVFASEDTCHSGRGRLSWTVTDGALPYKYFVDNSQLSNTYKNNLYDGGHTVQVSDANGCTDLESIAIGNIDLGMNGGTINVTPYDPVPGDEITLGYNLPPSWKSAQWEVNWVTYGNTPTITFPTTPEEQVINVKLYTRHYAGCIDSLESKLRLEEQYFIYIPSSFTPDQDGYNEFFFPVTVGIKELEGYIFDRWGEVIYTFKSIHDKWDGTYKGNICKSDTYAFRMIFTTNKGMRKEEFGKVTLLK